MADWSDFIQQIKRQNDIVDVIGGYLELRRSGANFMARCPFHGEKTPSFNVNRNLQIFKCFGCGESGDVIKFVEKYESCTFVEACEILAKRAGIPMPENSSNREDKELKERKKKRETYLAICRDAARFYYRAYYSEVGSVARSYVAKRGFDEATVKRFGIGYSPDVRSLPQFLRSKGYDMADCVKCGVLQANPKGEIDALAGRLIIPIFNMQSQVIAFGGRGLADYTISRGKYKNTAETPLFTKKDNLFAVNIAKEQKQQTALRYLVVVEGYMDVIAMYQAGFKGAVASMGTSLTEQQAKWLSRLSDTVYICYDGDAAGQKATVRGMDILDRAGLEVRVMTVPEKLDPDEYIKKYGAEAFEQLIEQAMPLPDYKLQLLERTFPIDSPDPAKRNNALPKYVKGALTMLKSLDDVAQARYITAVSVKTGYSEDYFRRKLSEGDTDVTEVAQTQLSPDEKAKYFVASCLLHGEPYATLDEKPICNTAFLSDLYDYLLQCSAQGQKPAADMLYTVCPNASAEQYAQILDVDMSKARRPVNERYFGECKRLIHAEKLRFKRDRLTQKIKENPSDSSLLTELAELSKKINDLR